MIKNRIALTLLIPLSLAACGGGGGGTSNGNTGGTTAAPASLAEAFSAASQQGLYPRLNQDHDVAGPDTDHNGVRDDIDAYIASLQDSAPQKSSLAQLSTALTQAMLVDTTDTNALTEVTRRLAAAAACIHARYADSSTASLKSSAIEQYTVNTRERFVAYEKFSTAISGTSFILPEGDGCAQ